MPGSKLTVKVLKEDCIGDGACVDSAPGTFQLDRDGCACVCSVITDSNDVILKTARACPTDAVVVIDEETGEQLVPEP
jgi:ferredoxin